ncbi:hypothetical protein TraAM80_06422 [Trypanosoma rangeli]|uniref:RanBD1 domain-containing protein n=1 Tax=Trypanosoma rangeli TaxID=5698 RepID=A0A422NAA2_TRYRA|nr:uncharacterized protein TraAM80_06422 [Trypanosoma rangeli]RNF02390.1 hypothetical protein TraAM80_06422 [Trypanosoma rangeli]|eukprot:RNF02390.1 hypothetical protein TraAM80_06422 [Trypanosoma rangeli]
MADDLERRKRRPLELTGRDEVLDNTPNYADAETMAQRRIVRVQRAPTGDAAPSLGGAFKAVPAISPAGGPTLFTKFLASDSANTNSSSGATSAPATASLLSDGKTAGSLFAGAKNLTFGVSSRSSTGVNDASDNSDKTNKTHDSVVAAGHEEGAGTSLFGGTFKFGGAPNTFAAAKERMAKTAANTQEEAPAQEKPAPSAALAQADPVTPSTEDVLACVSCKLFIFKSETKSWAECGAGDAKVKRHNASKAEDGEEAGKCLYRLTVRDGYALNELLCSNFYLTKAEDTHVIFTVPKNNGVATYFVKYTGQQAEAHGAEFTKTLKESLKLAQEDSS